jgi:hypothetical protein
MRRPRSWFAQRGGCWSPQDTCRPRGCPELSGGNRSRGAPGAVLRGPGVALSQEVGTGAAVTRGALGAALRREAGVAPGVAPIRSIVACFW